MMSSTQSREDDVEDVIDSLQAVGVGPDEDEDVDGGGGSADSQADASPRWMPPAADRAEQGVR